ncbi:hypothetical protein OSV50_005085 [Klebsiella pneumoniae]
MPEETLTVVGGGNNSCNDGRHYAWSGAAGNRIEAMQSAWHAYFE